ncbi:MULTISPECIES: hypothetical protein [Enterobacteriaceae]|uniref:hypothetical protein n=1 Tax=Enterobacteriaceae TaxID=543 RepID=UPI002005A4CE|nr:MULTISPECIES: hypothetical protein [Enterobacteriaceae]MCK7335473.1 hypothetical protein [Enterobacter kobei]MDS7879558.1 hypothetical protein [Klebsiella pasteurii]
MKANELVMRVCFEPGADIVELVTINQRETEIEGYEEGSYDAKQSNQALAFVSRKISIKPTSNFAIEQHPCLLSNKGLSSLINLQMVKHNVLPKVKGWLKYVHTARTD